ncbi:MAG: exonuclease SbcD [Oleiphilaceae bacterium]|jgi:exonuclease SbcD
MHPIFSIKVTLLSTEVGFVTFLITVKCRLYCNASLFINSERFIHLKIIHTSDWHLGQHFMGKSRQPEHQAFLDWLLELAVEHMVDAIIVAGDIFDTGSPPSYARELYNQFIVSLQATGVHLVILGGNHDSVAMLSESKSLLSYLNTHVIPGAMANPEEQVLLLKGANKEPIGLICAIPFLRARDIVMSLEGQSGAEKQHNLQMAISGHYQAVFAHAKEKQITLGGSIPIIATGHLTTVGAKTSESVRDIYIGTLDAFPSSAFPPAAYIALGHIHRHQKVGGSEHIRYCGSPIPLSFDELSNDKQVLIVEFKGAELKSVSEHKIPRFQAMHLIKGDLNEIEAEVKRLAPLYKTNQPAWLDIEVTTQDFLQDLQQRIQTLIEGFPLEVLLLRRARTNRQVGLVQENKETLHELTVKDVFERRLALEDWQGEEEEAKLKRLHQAFDEVVDALQQARVSERLQSEIKNDSLSENQNADIEAEIQVDQSK